MQLRGSTSKFLTCINLFLPTPHPRQATGSCSVNVPQVMPWFTVITYLLRLSCNCSAEQDEFLHCHALHKQHGNTFSTNKLWGPVFTCRAMAALLQISFYWTTGRENQNSTPRFKRLQPLIPSLTYHSRTGWTNYNQNWQSLLKTTGLVKAFFLSHLHWHFHKD